MDKSLVFLPAIVGAALISLGSGCSKPARRARPFPPPYFIQQGVPPEPPRNYAQPFAVPAANEAAVPATGASATASAATPPRQASLPGYKQDCESGAKLLGCGAFKSRAVGPADEATLELLTSCERGDAEQCEDVKTSSPPLVAWHQTLKASHCKSGYTALCSNYRACKRPSNWGCRKAADGQEVCGCVPRCNGDVKVETASRAWPDGSRRGAFTCTSVVATP